MGCIETAAQQVAALEELVGGRKKAKAIHAVYNTQRLKAAADYDRTSRLCEYEAIRVRQMGHDVNLADVS